MGVQRSIRGGMRLLAVLSAFVAFSVFQPPPAFADKVWGPSNEDLTALGGPLEALSAISKMLNAGEVNLCTFVGDHIWREQVSAKASGRTVTITCGAAKDEYVIDYAAHAVFGLEAMSGNDRIMFCEAKNSVAIFAIYDKNNAKELPDKYMQDNIACLETNAQKGRYKREVVRRFATAWTMLSRSWAFVPPDEAAIREQLKDRPAVTNDQQESLRRTQVQVEVAIKENRLLDAAQLYRTALTAIPNWAGGQFNDALLLADLEFFPSAIWHMRIYLLLSPDAPDARAARDKIYEWETKMPKLP